MARTKTRSRKSRDRELLLSVESHNVPRMTAAYTTDLRYSARPVVEKSATWVSKFLHEWCRRANSSMIESMQKLAKTLMKHKPLLLNWFESQGLSSDIVEGFNNKAKLTMRKAYSFREIETIQIALFQQLGKLPKTTYRFC